MKKWLRFTCVLMLCVLVASTPVIAAPDPDSNTDIKPEEAHLVEEINVEEEQTQQNKSKLYHLSRRK